MQLEIAFDVPAAPAPVAEAPAAPRREIVVFPFDREATEIRRIARWMRAHPVERWQKYWRTEANRRFGRLQVLGVPEDRIHDQIEALRRAIIAELRREDAR
ncbi:DUF6074 family protein [Prosthecomicrobium pneumaticum]|uniref:Uncharacterized protein n=1 Tax=Prosthecomicrobium pneumaticum TaxID=81895 RepID=A0A7W9FPR2_9HYPH|nr:DUF6074 family protein [Prosthecomicrobium pneumaticum]MBB5754624.1 hypothetical protein [Prosthecomicrobium pneumaticum]